MKKREKSFLRDCKITMSTLYDKLYDYSNSGYYGFHMPGHKRQKTFYKKDLYTNVNLPYELDITEIDGFDDLHHAQGVLLEAQERAARLYHAEESHFLVNGSTAGILSAVMGAAEKGDTVLVARNCHKSVYHAISIHELNPVYLYPAFDEELHLNTEIQVQDVEDALEHHPDIRAVIIVSPTYDGVVSDIEAIAEAVHKKGLPLIVDEAHGAHFGFYRNFPENACQRGADIVIHSLHKTLPALTQTALLHINGERVDREKVRKYLHMLQTSSPSYVLMASMDECMELLEKHGSEMFDSYSVLLEKTRKSLKGLKNLQIIRTERYDVSKIIISTKNAAITGKELYKILLEEYHLQMEMAAADYVLAMTSVADTKEGMERLTNALFSIDNRVSRKPESFSAVPVSVRAEAAYKIADAEFAMEGKKSMPWKESVGYISAEYAYLYPPGIPIIVPGERMRKEAAEALCWYKRHGFSVEGLKRESYIEVFVNE